MFLVSRDPKFILGLSTDTKPTMAAGWMYLEADTGDFYESDGATWTLNGGGGGGNHALLSATHTDSAASAVSRGSMIVGNATPAWAEVIIGAADGFWVSNGTDPGWVTPASARTSLGLGTVALLASDTDGTLAANSDARVATQKATKTYVDALIAANDAMVFKGVIDCSANPNYPAADRGHTYRVSVAGKIGGASGPNVEAGDILLCLTDGTAAGDHATVGAQWGIIQVNLDGAVIGPASAVGDRVATFDGVSGKLIKDSGLTLSGSNTGDQTITLTGDVTGSGTGTFATTIANDAVTFAKLQNVDAASLVGNITGTLGNATNIGLGDGLVFVGGLLDIEAAEAIDVITGTAIIAVTPASLGAIWFQGTDIASAATITIPDDSEYFFVTGTTTITDIDFTTTTGGRPVTLKFSGALTLTYHATNLILPTGANITTEAGDTAKFRSEGGDIVRCVWYQRASGQPLVAVPTAASQAEQETATSTTKFTTPGRQQFHPSACKAWVQSDSSGTLTSSYNVASVTDETTGKWTVNIATDMSSANYVAVGSAVSSLGADNVADNRSNITIRETAAGSYKVRATDISATSVVLADVAVWYSAAFGDQ